MLAPGPEIFNVDLRRMPGQIQLEWFDPVTGQVRSGGLVTGGMSRELRAPASHGALLYLRSAFSSAPSLASIENQVSSIRRMSMRYAPMTGRLRLLARPTLDSLTESYHRQSAAMLLVLLSGIGVGFAAGYFKRREP